MILNDHLSAGDGGARTAGSPRLIPRWPSLSSSSNTCAPESTPSADSIGDGTGESPCGVPSESPCGGGGVSLGSVPSESQGRAEGVEDTKGRRVCPFISRCAALLLIAQFRCLAALEHDARCPFVSRCAAGPSQVARRQLTRKSPAPSFSGDGPRHRRACGQEEVRCVEMPPAPSLV